MINSLKTIAVFGCGFTSRYRSDFCSSFNTVAEELGVNLVYVNSLGKIGNKNAQYGDYEFDLIDYIDLDAFDGIVFDGEGYNVEGMADKVVTKLKKAKCPVISISSQVDGFYNIDFDDCAGLRMLIEHFLDHHHFTKIGFMSGYLTHPDAQVRLKEFRAVMKSRGLPEDGVGMFEGDFWFHKGEEAADFFLSRPERPEAVVCANDYMAISLTAALKKRGLSVPEDIAVSGFDGSIEGREYLPHITSATRERIDIARKALTFLINIVDGKDHGKEIDFKVYPKPIFAQSCGCATLNYKQEAENINEVYNINRGFSYNLYDAESSMLKLNKADSIKKMGEVFNETAINFGDFHTFFMMMHTDTLGRPSYDSDYTCPSGKFTPIIWIDKKNEHVKPDHDFDLSELVPPVNTQEPHFYYIMSVHCAERMFGYSVIEMKGKGIFNEFFNVWLLNLAMTLETFLKNDRINKLIITLENLSITDGLTGMFNRRGFEEGSREALSKLDHKSVVCSMVIDMDGLKYINDVHGHYEGDAAIKTTADIISKCCCNCEIAGRAGGDEFYIFAPEYSQEKLDKFIETLNKEIARYNAVSKKPYAIQVSYGTYLTEADKESRLEDLIKVSDSRMYEQKMNKPNRRK